MHETCCKTYWIGAINTKVCATKSRCNFSQRTHLIHPHCTQNSYFGVFYSVWVHLGSFRNCMKLGAKRGELEQLMQKFVPQNHVGIFHNKQTQSTPLNVSVHFVVFGCIWDRSVTAWNLLQNILNWFNYTKVRARKSRCNFSQPTTWSTALDPKLMFWYVLKCLGAFGIVP